MESKVIVADTERIANKKAILVLGMHRSGTSALTGVLNILGGYIGLKGESSSDNYKGHFENLELVNLNETILTELNTSWDDTNNVTISRDSFPVNIMEDAIKMAFGEQSVVLIKDPRICLLLPLYINALNNLNYDIYYVGTHRKDSEIIQSLITRNEFSQDKCELLIKKYYSSINNTLPSNYLIVDFYKLLYETESIINELQKHLPFLNYADENKLRIEEFLDKSLKHH